MSELSIAIVCLGYAAFGMLVLSIIIGAARGFIDDWRVSRMWNRYIRKRCTRCTYDMRYSTTGVCPECGLRRA